MEGWAIGLIGAAGAIGGSAVTGLVAYRLARLESANRDKDELRIALAAYGAALDRLALQIDQMPQAHGIEEDWVNRLVARWRSLDWLIGRLSVATVGRGAIRAIDEVITATNRLMLIAPAPVVECMASVSDLIARLEPGRAQWKVNGTWPAPTSRTFRAAQSSDREHIVWGPARRQLIHPVIVSVRFTSASDPGPGGELRTSISEQRAGSTRTEGATMATATRNNKATGIDGTMAVIEREFGTGALRENSARLRWRRSA